MVLLVLPAKKKLKMANWDKKKFTAIFAQKILAASQKIFFLSLMVGEVFVPNSKSVVHFILVDFGKVGLEFDIKKN